MSLTDDEQSVLAQRIGAQLIAAAKLATRLAMYDVHSARVSDVLAAVICHAERQSGQPLDDLILPALDVHGAISEYRFSWSACTNPNDATIAVDRSFLVDVLRHIEKRDPTPHCLNVDGATLKPPGDPIPKEF